MRVAVLWADKFNEWISSMWRTTFVYTGLLGAGVETRLFSVRELMPQDGERWHPIEDWATHVIFERLAFEPFMSFVKRWREAGIKVFITFDDAYHLMPDYMRTPTKVWSDEGAAKEFLGNMKGFDGIIVPSVGLAAEISKFGGPVYVIPNYLDFGHPALQYALQAPITRDDNLFVVGWGGSHHHSVEHIVPVFQKLIKQRPETQIWIVGNNAAHNLVFGRVPRWNLRHFPRMPWGNYLATIKHFDVFAIPLEGRYDYCRSWVKPLEAAVMGVPWVATRNKIYRDCQGGVLVGNEKEWLEALLSPVEPAADWAKEQDISKHIGEYLDVLLGNYPHFRKGRRKSNRRRTKKRKG